MDKILKLDEFLTQETAKPFLKEWGWGEIIKLVPEGLMLELGVGPGKSFTDICQCSYPRKVYGFDWFCGLPEEWEIAGTARMGDLNGFPPSCPENGEFIIGRVEYTLPRFISKKLKPVAFVHFDLDLYNPTILALALLDSTHSFFSGTILVFDEIDNANPQSRNLVHEQKAFREWLKETEFDFEILARRHGESWVVRLI